MMHDHTKNASLHQIPFFHQPAVKALQTGLGVLSRQNRNELVKAAAIA